MSLCHRTPLLVWSCTSWSRMALHMLTQSKLGIQTGKELHSHLNFLPVRNLILKAENFRRTQNTQKLKHKKRQTKKKLHCSQSNWRAVNYIFSQSQIHISRRKPQKLQGNIKVSTDTIVSFILIHRSLSRQFRFPCKNLQHPNTSDGTVHSIALK